MKMPRNSTIIILALALYLIAFTCLHFLLWSNNAARQAAQSPQERRHRYKFEDEDSIFDDASQDSALRHRLVVAKRFKELFQQELQDGLALDSQKVTDLSPANNKWNGIIHRNGGLREIDLPRSINCPDGDDEHVYRLRRAYPCQLAAVASR